MTVTYKDIQSANGEMKTISIKGKDYPEVSQRIKAFRMVYPMGFIIPELLSDELNGEGKDAYHTCKFKATVGFYTDNGECMTLGVGHAYENEKSSFINTNSYLENAETSAVGRALAMAGFGDATVASAEEMQSIADKPQEEQKAPKKASANQINIIKKLVNDIPALLEFYKIDKLEDLSIKQASEIITKKKEAK